MGLNLSLRPTIYFDRHVCQVLNDVSLGNKFMYGCEEPFLQVQGLCRKGS